MPASHGKKPATYEDIVELPEHFVGEIVDGELFASPRPTARHSLAASSLGYQLGGPFQLGARGPGGWCILVEPELHLRGDVLVPDLAGWRLERMPEVPDAPFFTLAPDWVCEVLSPSTERLDLVRKLPKYAASGVPHAWIVDPARQSLQTFSCTSGGAYAPVATFHDAETVRAEPFAAVELGLAALWRVRGGAAP